MVRIELDKELKGNRKSKFNCLYFTNYLKKMMTSSYHGRPIAIGSPILTVLMAMAALMMMTGSVDCLSSSQQNHRFVDILAAHQPPSKLNLCMM